MKPRLKYIYIVLLHKLWVFIYCIQLKAPLYLAILHDWSKFTPAEFNGYVTAFYNKNGSSTSFRNKDGSFNPAIIINEFKFSWCIHQKNKHHWQYWVSIGDHGQLFPVDIPEKYIREMIADWMSAGKVYESGTNAKDWWEINKSKMVLSINTTRRIQIILENL